MALLGGSSSDAATVFNSGKYDDLYRRAGNVSRNDTGTDFAKQFNDPAFAGFDRLAGGGAQGANPDVLNNMANGQYQNEALGGAIDAGLGDITRNFQRNLLPAISGGSVMSGGSGGSRQGIAEGLAVGDANRNASDFVSRMRSDNFKTMLGSQTDALGLQNEGANISNTATGAALQLAPEVQNLGFGSQYGNLAALKGVMGGPTALSGASKQQQGALDAVGGMASFAF